MAARRRFINGRWVPTDQYGAPQENPYRADDYIPLQYTGIPAIDAGIRAQNEALGRNLARYGDIKEGYDERYEAGMRPFFLEEMQNKQRLAEMRNSLVDRGMSSSTFGHAGMTRLQAQQGAILADSKASLDARLRKEALDFQERRTDQYPDLRLMAQMYQSAGAGGYGLGGYGRGGRGGMSRRALNNKFRNRGPANAGQRAVMRGWGRKQTKMPDYNRAWWATRNEDMAKFSGPLGQRHRGQNKTIYYRVPGATLARKGMSSGGYRSPGSYGRGRTGRGGASAGRSARRQDVRDRHFRDNMIRKFMREGNAAGLRQFGIGGPRPEQGAWQGPLPQAFAGFGGSGGMQSGPGIPAQGPLVPPVVNLYPNSPGMQSQYGGPPRMQSGPSRHPQQSYNATQVPRGGHSMWAGN